MCNAQDVSARTKLKIARENRLDYSASRGRRSIKPLNTLRAKTTVGTTIEKEILVQLPSVYLDHGFRHLEGCVS